jgi:hypothetical protein
MVSAANEFSLRNVLLAANRVVGSESVSLPNCVVSSESIFAAELCCLQRMRFHC